MIPNSYEKIEDEIIQDNANSCICVRFICKNSKGKYEILEKQF